MNITLDKTDPAIAEAFSGCKPGDTYKVVSDDDTELVLKKTGGGYEEMPDDEMEEEPMPPRKPMMAMSDNPAIAKAVGRRMKSVA